MARAPAAAKNFHEQLSIIIYCENCVCDMRSERVKYDDENVEWQNLHLVTSLNDIDGTAMHAVLAFCLLDAHLPRKSFFFNFRMEQL